MSLIKQLAATYNSATIRYPILKPVTLAQWMLESGRGTSKLATEHLNFGGLKWRSEMQGYATKVLYQAHDGEEYYCKFASLEAYVIGYWRFIERPPYAGWEQHTASGEDYIRFIAPKYTPSPTYPDKVLALVPEANELLNSIAGKKGTIVIDPGHGGKANTGNSSWNNAIAKPSGILEKAMTLEMALLIKSHLQKLSSNTGSQIKVILTRESDVNLGLAARANFAKKNKADLFVSLHFNGFNGISRGVETLILPKEKNTNFQQDQAFATKIQADLFATLLKLDPNTKNRNVKEQSLGVLSDVELGNTFSASPTRACLVEIEFIDVPAVDALLNTGPKAKSNKDAIAKSIAESLFKSL